MSAAESLPPWLQAERPLHLLLADGSRCSGSLQDQQGQWILLNGPGGATWINLAQVIAVAEPGSRLPRAGSAKKATAVAADGGEAPPNGNWSDDDLRQFAEAVLDGADDAQLAAAMARSRSAVKTLRSAFECARGNLVEDEISPAAAAWVPRIRKTLAGR